jgi:DNA invertase Pin-like site-specific DNA recombinase
VRLVGYVRVSSETQIEGYGLDVQERSIRAWARAHNHRLIDVLRDEGVSGAKEAADRPGLSAALVYFAHPRRADGLVVPRLDRLARALTIQEATLGLIWREGGHVFTADAGEVLRDDPDDPMRTALRQVVGVFAELDRRMTVKRMKDGRKAKAATGKHAVGQYAFGYHGEGKGRDRDAGPNPAEQASVDEIVRRRRAGETYRGIAAVLDSAGLRPRRAERWSAMAVRSVARRHGLP